MADWGESHPAELWFGVQTEEEISGTDVMEDIAASMPGFRYEVFVGEPTKGWTGAVGTPLDRLATELAESPAPPDIYVLWAARNGFRHQENRGASWAPRGTSNRGELRALLQLSQGSG